MTVSLEPYPTLSHPNGLVSLCHPVYDDQLMHRALRHAIYSAIANNIQCFRLKQPRSCSYHVGEDG